MQRYLLLSLASSAFLGPVAVGEVGKSPGQIYPDFVLPAIDDRRPVALSDYRGKKVILIEYASW